MMTLENLTQNMEKKDVEELSKGFAKLIDSRNYKEARVYYDNLNDDTKKYIRLHKEYEWKLKALSFSRM